MKKKEDERGRIRGERTARKERQGDTDNMDREKWNGGEKTGGGGVRRGGTRGG